MTPLQKIRKRIAELREMGEKACPGPWHINAVYDGVAKAVVTSQSHPLCQLSEPFHRQCHHGTGQDAEFIAASRTALPAALAALEEMAGALEKYQGISHAPANCRSVSQYSAASEALARAAELLGKEGA